MLPDRGVIIFLNIMNRQRTTVPVNLQIYSYLSLRSLSIFDDMAGSEIDIQQDGSVYIEPLLLRSASDDDKKRRNDKWQ